MVFEVRDGQIEYHFCPCWATLLIFEVKMPSSLSSVLSSRTLQLNFMNIADELQNSGISWTETILKPIQDTNLVKKLIKKVKKRSLSSRP